MDETAAAAAEPAEWRHLVTRARALLCQVAGAGATITYGEVQERLGVTLPSSGPRALSALLRVVSESEEADGAGLVSAVVVRRSGRPGPGWFRLAAVHGRDVSDPDSVWRVERNRLQAALSVPGPARQP